MAPRPSLTLATLLALTLPAAALAQTPRDSLTIGITQYPATWHPNIEAMAAKAYVEGFTLRPLTAYTSKKWGLRKIRTLSVL